MVIKLEKTAEQLYQQGKKQAAVQLLAHKLQQDMSHLDWFLQLSGYLTSGGDLVQSEELLLRAKQIFPNSQEIDYNLAVIYFIAGKLEQSQQWLQNITDNKLASDVYYLMSKQFLQKRQIERALAYALTAYEKNSHLDDNCLLLGDIFLQLKRFSNAQDYYKRALELKKTAPAYFKLALVEMVCGDTKFSQHFQKAKQLDKSYFSTHQQQLADIERYLTTQAKDE